jgi:hypothetical protein
MEYPLVCPRGVSSWKSSEICASLAAVELKTVWFATPAAGAKKTRRTPSALRGEYYATEKAAPGADVMKDGGANNRAPLAAEPRARNRRARTS